jgi:hypothetical protein
LVARLATMLRGGASVAAKDFAVHTLLNILRNLCRDIVGGNAIGHIVGLLHNVFAERETVTSTEKHVAMLLALTCAHCAVRPGAGGDLDRAQTIISEQPHAVEAIVALLDHARRVADTSVVENVSLLMSSLRHGDRLAEAGTTSPLVALLSSSSAVVRSLAVLVINNIVNAAGGRHIQYVVATGAIAPLVALLSSECPTAKKVSATVLTRLACEGEHIAQLVADAGSLEPLVAMLRPATTTTTTDASSATTHQLCASAAHAIACLSQWEPLRLRAIQAGALAPLVAVLRGDDKRDCVRGPPSKAIAAITGVDMVPCRAKSARCAHCNADAPRLMRCERCLVMQYCGGECQAKHWREGGHRTQCKLLQPDGRNES